MAASGAWHRIRRSRGRAATGPASGPAVALLLAALLAAAGPARADPEPSANAARAQVATPSGVTVDRANAADTEPPASLPALYPATAPPPAEIGPRRQAVTPVAAPAATPTPDASPVAETGPVAPGAATDPAAAPGATPVLPSDAVARWAVPAMGDPSPAKTGPGARSGAAPASDAGTGLAVPTPVPAGGQAGAEPRSAPTADDPTTAATGPPTDVTADSDSDPDDSGPVDDVPIMLVVVATLLTLSLVGSAVGFALLRPATRGAPALPGWTALAQTGGEGAIADTSDAARQSRALLETAGLLWREVEAAVLDLKAGLPLRTLLLEELSHISRRLSRSPALHAAKSGAVTTGEPDQYWKLLARDISRSIRDMNRIKAVAEAGRASFGAGSNEPRMPTSVEEAYFVLGANRNVDGETLTRLVRALRQCWHPDLAQTSEDRGYREGRIRQINIANDIIRAHTGHSETTG